ATLRSKGVRYVIVLGGDGPGHPRLREGTRLWREIPDSKLVLLGDTSGSLDALAELSSKLGVPKDALIPVLAQGNTADEAVRIKPIVGSDPFALVTSAYHIPRAIQLFRAQLADPIPCPCEFNGWRPSTAQLLVPRVRNLMYARLPLREYYGRLFYWVKGLGLSAFCPASSRSCGNAKTASF
ncbi:MAG: YdcF family protein, partial [Desulfomonilaceae bacterium]